MHARAAARHAQRRRLARRPGPQREAPDARGGTGPVDVGALRQRWPEILDAVRSKSKVAWILLNTASVQELEGGTLTIAFPSEGNARGFASSGHDQVLTGALAALLGLNVRVRAVAGGPQSAGSPAAGTQAASSQATGRAAPGQAAGGRPAPGRAHEGLRDGRFTGRRHRQFRCAIRGSPATPPAPQPGGRTAGAVAAPDDSRPAPAARAAASGQQPKAARSRSASPGPRAAASPRRVAG
jgi:DNA polymerase-3 subunit gamma/tau